MFGSCFRTLAVILFSLFFFFFFFFFFFESSNPRNHKMTSMPTELLWRKQFGMWVSIKINQGVYYMRSVEYIFKGWNYLQGQGHIESSTLPCLSILHPQSQPGCLLYEKCGIYLQGVELSSRSRSHREFNSAMFIHPTSSEPTDSVVKSVSALVNRH